MSNNDNARGQRRNRRGRFIGDRSATGRALSAARLRLITAQADAAEDELRRLKASVITREDADATWAAMKAAIRGRLLLVPGQAIDGVMAATTPAAVEDVLRTVIYQALTDLADTSYIAARPRPH